MIDETADPGDEPSAAPSAHRPREFTERLPSPSLSASHWVGTPPSGKLTPELVYWEYAPCIYNLSRRMLGNDTDAEDATQDVLLKVVRKQDTFRGEAKISTWLYRVTVNAALAHRQKRANRYKHETGETTDALLETLAFEISVKQRTGAPDEQILAAERREAIERATRHLTGSVRVVYLHADMNGMTNPQISDLLGLSLSAVKSRLHRARMRMRGLLRQYSRP